MKMILKSYQPYSQENSDGSEETNPALELDRRLRKRRLANYGSKILAIESTQLPNQKLLALQKKKIMTN